MPQRYGKHFRDRRDLEVERQIDLFAQPLYVAVGDVAPILAQMGGDPVGAGLGRDVRRAQRIGIAPAARVAEGRDVVDVDAKAQPGRHDPASRAADACLFRRRSWRRKRR